MKILHITRSEELGIRAFLVGLLANTDREIFELKVAGPLKGPMVEDLKRLGIPALMCPIERDIKPVHDLRNFVQICSLVRRERPDVLHLHGAKAGFLGRLAGRINRVPAIVYTPNNDYLDEPNSRWRNSMVCLLEKAAARLEGQIVSVTAEERQSWLKRRICQEKRIVTIHDGFDFSRATVLIDKASAKEALGIPEDCKVVGLIARLVPQKAPHIFLQAAANVLKVNPNVRFLLVGEGPMQAELKSLAAMLGIASQLLFLSFVPNLSQVFSAMDVSVLTSLYEGLPMVVLESMYLGIPIVVSRTYGVREVVPEECGFVTTIGNPQNTAVAITRILHDPAAAKKMALRARAHVLANFGAARMAQQYQQLYLQLLAQSEVAGTFPEPLKPDSGVEFNAASHD
jgi:glycosyltransferase involved in cell wall biosynthesis